MSWFKVDDKLHDHRKARKAGKAAMGVWVLAGSWSMDNDTDGFVPADVLARWGTAADARKLIDAGLWDRETFQGEDGFRFHDWTRFQPSAAVTAARRAKESEAAMRGNHSRWHLQRGISDPDCEYCYRVPDQAPDQAPDRVSVGSVSGQDESAPNRPVPVPEPTTSSNEEVGDPEPRADVLRICEYLADAIVENGSKRPSITKSWLDEARRMLDIDGRTEEEVLRAIDWCQRGESDRARFWRPNVLSMPKLRAKFDQMRLQAANETRATTQPKTRVQEHLTLVQRLAAEESDHPTLPQIGGGR